MQKNIPLVSIIMSEYNTDQKLLIESIKSIINQTYQNIELILIDDCGKNNVKKIVEKINDSRIKVYKNQKNSGLVYSLNKAIEKSNGKYIARMDTDDYAYPNRIELQVNFMEQNLQYDIIGGNAIFSDGIKDWGKTTGSGEITKEQMLRGCPLIHPSTMYKKEVIKDIGGYQNYQRCEDYATWIEAFSKGYRLYKINEIVIKYHLSKEDYKKRTLKTRKGFFKMLKYQYKKLNPTILNLYKIYIKTFIAGIIPGPLMYKYHYKTYNDNRMQTEK